jgi:hypothetical protein
MSLCAGCQDQIWARLVTKDVPAHFIAIKALCLAVLPTCVLEREDGIWNGVSSKVLVIDTNIHQNILPQMQTLANDIQALTGESVLLECIPQAIIGH